MINKDDNIESIKIGCFGDSCVGKTYLIRKYVNDITNIDSTITTAGIDYYATKRILSNGKKYKITIYDTAGQEKYKSLSLYSIRHCDGVILMYDITKKDSFNSVSEWINNIYDIKEKNFPFILVGNKCDLKDEREISEEEGLEAAEKYKTKYFEVSSREGINVEKAIDELLNKIISKNIIPKIKTIKLDIRKNIAPNKHKCC